MSDVPDLDRINEINDFERESILHDLPPINFVSVMTIKKLASQGCECGKLAPNEICDSCYAQDYIIDRYGH